MFYASIGDPLVATGVFAQPTRHEIEWIDRLTVHQLVQRIGTTSSHRLLDERTRSDVARALTSALGGRDTTLTVGYRTIVLIAERR